MAPILCYVTHSAALPEPLTDSVLDVIRRAIAAGVDWIQIREKNFSGRELSALAHQALRAAHGSPTRILINGRLDAAIASGAGGVHLGSDALPVADVAEFIRRLRRFENQIPKRSELPSPEAPASGIRTEPQSTVQRRGDLLIGASCHSLEEAQAAERDGADYIFFGPVFSTPAKEKYGPPQGVTRLEEICRAIRIPVLAIGGITPENAADCLRAGAAGIAAIHLFQENVALTTIVKHLHALAAPRSSQGT